MIDVSSPGAAQSLMERYGVRTKKRLGQNFLVDGNIVEKIVRAAGVSPEDAVVEIGPGLGALTASLARQAGIVLAVEIDRNLIPLLSETLSGAGRVELLCQDALKTDFDELVREKTSGHYGRGGKPYKALANLPYYITSPLLLHLLTSRFNLSVLVLMVQREVAARLTALPGTKDYGSLSVVVQYFAIPKLLFLVPRTVFMPAPAVDSAVVRFDLREEPAVPVQDEELFFKVVRASFGQRRKTVLNALGAGLGLSRKDLGGILAGVGIDPGRRGETFSLSEFAVIADAIKFSHVVSASSGK